jgi:hypothetical protein
MAVAVEEKERLGGRVADEAFSLVRHLTSNVQRPTFNVQRQNPVAAICDRRMLARIVWGRRS